MTMPWEKPASDGLDIPPMLKRDANNRAPFMDLCVDEGCPQHGMTHVCISPSRHHWTANNRAPFMDTYAASLTTGLASPSTNLPAFDPSALPPWAATFPPRGA
jgi:hypothetical protein